MATIKKFTAEEMENLKANPYTLRVSENSISFSLTFKKAFWKLSLQGHTAPGAFRKLGYEPEVLGRARVKVIAERIRRSAKTPEGLRERSGGIRINKPSGDETTERMQHEILYLQQQMEFLKNYCGMERPRNEGEYSQRQICADSRGLSHAKVIY